MCERGVPGGALNVSSTSYPDHGRCGNLPLQGKILTAEPGIEPETLWLVVRSSDHQATRLIVLYRVIRSLETLFFKQRVTTEVYLLIFNEFVNQLTDDELTTGCYQ
jgi:hypothetical protein